MCVNAQSCLVQDEVAVGVQVAVVHFGLWGRGDVVVMLAKELGVRGAVVACVGEDDGDRLVEEGEGVVQEGGEVRSAIDAAVCVSG